MDVHRRYEAITTISRVLKKRMTANNVDLMVGINSIISEYVQIE